MNIQEFFQRVASLGILHTVEPNILLGIDKDGRHYLTAMYLVASDISEIDLSNTIFFDDYKEILSPSVLSRKLDYLIIGNYTPKEYMKLLRSGKLLETKVKVTKDFIVSMGDDVEPIIEFYKNYNFLLIYLYDITQPPVS